MTETPPQIDTPAAVDRPPTEVDRSTVPTPFERVVGSGDHRTIGRFFIGCSLVFLAVSAAASLLADADIASDGSILQVEVTQRLLMNHQVGLLLLGILPLLLGIAIAVVPAQVGSPTVAFPRAAAASLWTWLSCSIIYVVAVVADGGYGGERLKAARLGNIAVGGILLALCLGAVCVAVTVLNLRPAGLSLARVPFFAFSMLVAATIWIFTLPAALAHVIFTHIQRPTADTLVTAGYNDGLAWLFGQPAVFMVLIPALGIVADVVATAVGGRQRFRGAVQSFIGLAGLTSYGAWAQGQGARGTLLWVVVSLAAALPALGVLALSADTLRQGKLSLMSPLAFGVLGLLVGLLGAGVGALQAINSAGVGELGNFDLPSVVIAQYRLVLGAALVVALGAVVYWARPIFGSSVPDGPAKGLAPLAALAVVAWGAPWLVAGLAKADVEPYAGVAAAGAGLVGLVSLAVLGAALQARRVAGRGDVLLADVWGGGGTLEWADPSLELGSIESPYPVLDAGGKAES